MLKKIINNKILILILPLIFGLLGGLAALALAGEIFAPQYGWPFSSAVDLTSDFTSGRFIISEPKNVIVQEDAKVKETADSGKESLVGIFKKKNPPESAKAGQIAGYSGYYLLTDNVPQGLVITSDGWIMAKNFDAAAGSLADNYVVITAGQKIFPVEKSVVDKLGNYTFLKIKADGLPVKGFSSLADIYPGMSLVIAGRRDLVLASSITEVRMSAEIKSSDYNPREIIINDPVRESFKGSFVFNLGGSLAGLVNNEGKIEHVNNFLSAVDSLLKYGEVKRPFFGVDYINVKNLAGFPEEKGALVVKGPAGEAVKKNSPAAKAGLRENDIILGINGLEIDKNNDLEAILAQYKIGNKIKVKFKRGAEVKETEATIEELK